jgi:hypothetical protein
MATFPTSPPLPLLVAFDRINDNVHFASLGALIGTVTGRFLVARHRRIDRAEEVRSTSFDPIWTLGGIDLDALTRQRPCTR